MCREMEEKNNLTLPRLHHRGTSSNGRALASHARGTGIDAPVLQPLANILATISASNFHPVQEQFQAFI